jgi:hypothetical protein
VVPRGETPFKNLKKDAVFYRYCVEKGLIKDPEPVKTIALSYGVSTSAVQEWGQDSKFEHVKRHDPKAPPRPMRYQVSIRNSWLAVQEKLLTKEGS